MLKVVDTTHDFCIRELNESTSTDFQAALYLTAILRGMIRWLPPTGIQVCWVRLEITPQTEISSVGCSISRAAVRCGVSPRFEFWRN